MHTTDALTIRPADTAARAERIWLDPNRYPFALRDLEVEGYRLSYVDEGTGQPLLFVHGTPSWSFEWRNVIGALRGECRCVAPDHLGFGLSEKPADADYRPADHARRLLALVECLDLRDITLVVHDFGGPIGLWVALQAPERFRDIIIVNSFAWDLRSDPRVRRISRVVASPLGRFLYRWLNASPRWLLPASFADRRVLTPALHRHYLGPFATRRDRIAPWVLGCELAASGDFFQSLWDERARWPQVRALIWGMRDPTFDATALQRWSEAFPDAITHRIADAGHFPQEENPAAVVEALRRG